MFFKNMLKTLNFWRITMTNQLAVVMVKQCIWEGNKGAIAPNHHYLSLSIQISPGNTPPWIKGTVFSKKNISSYAARRERVGRFISCLISSSLDILHVVFNSNSSLLGVSNTAPQPTSPRVSRHQRYPTCQEGCFSEAPPLIARIMSNGFKTPMGVLTVEPRFDTGMNGKGSTPGSTGLRKGLTTAKQKSKQWRSCGKRLHGKWCVCFKACVD